MWKLNVQRAQKSFCDKLFGRDDKVIETYTLIGSTYGKFSCIECNKEFKYLFMFDENSNRLSIQPNQTQILFCDQCRRSGVDSGRKYITHRPATSKIEKGMTNG